MEEKELKTSVKQRIFISLIAIIMVGTFVASYAAIVISGNSGSSSSSGTSEISEEKIAEYEREYNEKLGAFKEGTAGDFAVFSPYMSEVKAYNETSANDNGVASRDLLVGGGRELTEGDINYIAYYVGWCADESIFDSSLDNTEAPTAFSGALNVSETGEYGSGMIAGWYSGMLGARLGGVREITIPGNEAYGSTREICGGYDKPLKFLVMAVENEGERATLLADLELASMKVQAAYYGIDYEGTGE